jgi:hypothetical protein
MLVGPGGLDSSPLPSSPESLTACHAHENAYAFWEVYVHQGVSMNANEGLRT